MSQCSHFKSLHDVDSMVQIAELLWISEKTDLQVLLPSTLELRDRWRLQNRWDFRKSSKRLPSFLKNHVFFKAFRTFLKIRPFWWRLSSLSMNDYLMLTAHLLSNSPSSPRWGHKPRQPGCTKTLSSESQVRCSPSMWRWRSKPVDEFVKLRIVSQNRLVREGYLLGDKSQRSVDSHLALFQLHLGMYLL